MGAVRIAGRARAGSPAAAVPGPKVSVGRVQTGPLVRSEFQVRRGQVLVQLGHRGGTGQRDHRQLATDLPGQHDLVGSRSRLLRHLLEHGEPGGVSRVVVVGGQRLVLRPYPPPSSGE